MQAIDKLGAGSNTNAYTPEDTPPPGKPEAPAANSVQAFDSAMKNTGTDGAGMDNALSGSDQSQSENSAAGKEQLDDLLKQILQLLQQMLSQISQEGETGDTKGGSIATPGEGVSPVEGKGPGGSAGGSERIPPPTEHVQQLNLGGKTVTVGGDGTSSAAEVNATAESINNLYQNSPTFKNMIDSSSDPSFEVSVGKRDDNTSWGNTGGKVFMNINNVEPGNNDSFQSLLGHEFAHASIDLGHGAHMEQTQNKVAREA